MGSGGYGAVYLAKHKKTGKLTERLSTSTIFNRMTIILEKFLKFNLTTYTRSEILFLLIIILKRYSKLKDYQESSTFIEKYSSMNYHSQI